MNTRLQQTTLKPVLSSTSVQGGLLQRKCMCGNHTMAGSECMECKKNQLMEQASFPLQTKLTISQPGDQYEQEADRVAEQVMRIPNSGVSHISRSPVHVQRMCTACSSGKGLCPKCAEEKKQQLQRKEANGSKGVENPATVHEVIGAAGQPLDAATRAFMEPRFGYDFSQVRVHTDARAAKSARAINALAYTMGRNIVFRNGEYSPSTDNGRELLAHELTHVIQQSNFSMLHEQIQRDADEEEVPPEPDMPKPDLPKELPLPESEDGETGFSCKLDLLNPSKWECCLKDLCVSDDSYEKAKKLLDKLLKAKVRQPDLYPNPSMSCPPERWNKFMNFCCQPETKAEGIGCVPTSYLPEAYLNCPPGQWNEIRNICCPQGSKPIGNLCCPPGKIPQDGYCREPEPPPPLGDYPENTLPEGTEMA